MAILSMRTREKIWDVLLAAFIATIAWFLQVTVLNKFHFLGSMCNLPLTIVIVWGFVFGSVIPPISTDELRLNSTGQIFLHQIISGSFSGALIGAFVSALYSSSIPIYAICYPIIGWVSGYFCARSLNRETLLCIPVVLLGSVLANAIMSWQLTLLGRTDAISHLSQIALPEGIINALIAPLVYFPIRRWYDLFQTTSAQP